MSLAEVCATCLEMSMWSFSGGVTLKCCSSNFFYQFQKASINMTSLLSNNSHFMLYQLQKKLLSTKWQWVYFLTFERSKKQKKMALLKVVLDQVYQLMVFETPSDHFFQRRSPFRQTFGRPPNKKKYITNTKIQDI